MTLGLAGEKGTWGMIFRGLEIENRALEMILVGLSLAKRVVSAERRVIPWGKRGLSYEGKVSAGRRRAVFGEGRVLPWRGTGLGVGERVLSRSRRVLSSTRRVVAGCLRGLG